jgi:sulfoxide reductase heme-binding subunit YedZ
VYLAAVTITANSRALWYLTRGFGLVALILLTVTMVVGLTQAVRFARPGWPRFVISALHRNAALLAGALLVVHIVTAVLDSYAPIRIVDIFIPFVSSYRPVWLGLGAIALDLLVALLITSLLRERLGQRAWRAVHWAAYACWPLAVVHGLGTGSDTRLGWVLFINAVCVAAVLAALWWRLARGWSAANAPRRGVAVLLSIALPAAVVAWTASGPLRPGWARRAGTPATLLASSASPAAKKPATGAASGATLTVPFSARFEGTQHQVGPDRTGLVTITISGSLHGNQSGRLSIVLTGQPVDDGGVELTGSQVQLGTASAPEEYQGHVARLTGTTLVADLANASGAAVTATIDLQLSQGHRAVTGTVRAT